LIFYPFPGVSVIASACPSLLPFLQHSARVRFSPPHHNRHLSQWNLGVRNLVHIRGTSAPHCGATADVVPVTAVAQSGQRSSLVSQASASDAAMSHCTQRLPGPIRTNDAFLPDLPRTAAATSSHCSLFWCHVWRCGGLPERQLRRCSPEQGLSHTVICTLHAQSFGNSLTVALQWPSLT
jgi:hypothetical protein